MDARRQYPAFLDYGLKHGILTEGSEVRYSLPFSFPQRTRDAGWVILMMSTRHIQTYDKSKDLVDRCMKLLDEAEIEPIHIGLCERILGTVAEGRDRTYVALFVSSVPGVAHRAVTWLYFILFFGGMFCDAEV